MQFITQEQNPQKSIDSHFSILNTNSDPIMINQHQLIQLVYQNIHLYNSQINLDSDFILQKTPSKVYQDYDNFGQKRSTYNQQEQTRNSRNLQKKDLLLKINQTINLNDSSSYDQIGFMQLMERQKMWHIATNRQKLSRSKRQKSYRYHELKDQLNQTTVYPSKYNSVQKDNMSRYQTINQNLHSTVKPLYHSSYKGNHDEHQRRQTIQERTCQQISNQANRQNNNRFTLQAEESMRKFNRLLDDQQDRNSRDKSLKRRKKIFTLETKKQLVKPQERIRNLQLNVNIQKEEQSKIADGYNKQTNEYKIQKSQKQNLNYNSVIIRAELPLQDKQVPKRQSLDMKKQLRSKYFVEGDYLPSPGELNTILKTIDHSKQTYLRKTDNRKSIYHKKLNSNIKYHQFCQFQPVINLQTPEPQFIPPHPSTFHNSRFVKYQQKVANSTRIKFSYAGTSQSPRMDKQVKYLE